jgi:predicted transcriptional regulator
MTPICGTRCGVLMAVLHQDRPTMQSVAAEVDAAHSTVVFHLHALEHLGLIGWEHGKRGTLRALVTYEPVGQS